MKGKRKSNGYRGPALGGVSVDEDIAKAYKEKCDELDIPRGLFLEASMQEFLTIKGLAKLKGIYQARANYFLLKVADIEAKMKVMSVEQESALNARIRKGLHQFIEPQKMYSQRDGWKYNPPRAPKIDDVHVRLTLIAEEFDVKYRQVLEIAHGLDTFSVPEGSDVERRKEFYKLYSTDEEDAELDVWDVVGIVDALHECLAGLWELKDEDI